jgi:carbon monoxide dehydrogenase subunit G
VNLTGEGDQTKLLLGASVDILGKLATLGHSMIKRKADQVMDEFAGNLKQKLEADA